MQYPFLLFYLTKIFGYANADAPEGEVTTVYTVKNFNLIVRLHSSTHGQL